MLRSPVASVDVALPVVTTAGVTALIAGEVTVVTVPATLVTTGVSTPLAGEVVFTTAPTSAPA